jgi:histidine kinase/DNA gyrase B/HSP90-like ATPase
VNFGKRAHGIPKTFQAFNWVQVVVGSLGRSSQRIQALQQYPGLDRWGVHLVGFCCGWEPPRCTPEGGRIELKLRRNGAQDVLCVSDTGPGIPEAERDLVTRRFYRSESSRHTAPGLGLGLSLVHAIVKLHGFQLAVLPEPGCVVQIALRGSSSPRSGQRRR